jgi:hypothetical protein
VQVPSIRTSALGRSILLMSYIFVLAILVLFVEAAMGMIDEAQKLYNFVHVLRKLKIFGVTEDHIL